jgi:hypothetical protein
VKGLVLRCLKRTGQWLAGSAAVLAVVGLHGPAAPVVAGVLAIVLAVLAYRMLRWTLASSARSDRLIRMILALRGDARSLPHDPLASPPPAFRRSPQIIPAVKAPGPQCQHEAAETVEARTRRRPAGWPAPAVAAEKVDGPLRQQEAVGMVKAPRKGPRTRV